VEKCRMVDVEGGEALAGAEGLADAV